ncbi:uncharacterized protein JCM6883_004353 [Sporobolomyces salmoneus]|uniref:uncharacterized protein n=1 Tax=Sporobolomyces salmoneus TaxID=183962 RepID=UPI00316D0DD0
MLSTSPNLNLPSGASLVSDADEEIFLLYTKKQQASIRLSALTAAQQGREGGLGINSDSGDLLELSLSIENPWRKVEDETKRKKGKKVQGKAKELIEVEVELHQSLNALRNRAGDTGSVLWRLSLHFAKFFLTSHHFPHPSFPFLLPNLSTSSILELGSGTGFLGIVLRSIFAKSPSDFKWTFSDQLDNLPLILRNLQTNSLDSSPSYSIVELDWIQQSQEYLSNPSLVTRESPSFPNLIFAVDCIYNPSLSAPLVHTILHNSGPETIVVVVSELRESEALETFLSTWLEEGEKRFQGFDWKVARLDWEQEGGEDGKSYRERVVGDLGDSEFVVWIVWCDTRAGEE